MDPAQNQNRSLIFGIKHFSESSQNTPQESAVEFLTDYVLCSGQCLLRDEAWSCEGACQPHSQPCGSRCPTIVCPHEWLYAHIGGRCVKVPNQVHCAADAKVPLYTGAVSGLATLQQRSLNPSLFNTTSLWSLADPCPGPLYCRSRTNMCCLVIGGSPNRPLKCPTSC